MIISSRSVLLASATFLCAVVACTSSSTSTSGSDGTTASGSDDTSKSEGPTTCSGDCAECEPAACLCDDGTTVRQCACSTGSKLVCADSEFCSTLHGCDDHGGPAAKQPSTSTSKKDAGTNSNADEVLVTGRLDTAAKTQTSGKYTLLVDEAQSVTYVPDNLGGVTFKSTGFSSSELGEPTITSPAAKSCKPTIEFGLGLGNATLTVSGTDTTNTDCNTFVNAVFSDGIELSFADVKFNGHTITSLKVNLAGH